MQRLNRSILGVIAIWAVLLVMLPLLARMAPGPSRLKLETTTTLELEGHYLGVSPRAIACSMCEEYVTDWCNAQGVPVYNYATNVSTEGGLCSGNCAFPDYENDTYSAAVPCSWNYTTGEPAA